MKILLLIVSVLTMLLSGCAANQIVEPSFEKSKVCCICHRNHRQHCYAKLLTYPPHRFIAHRPLVTKKTIEKPIKTGQSTPLLTDGFAIVQYQLYQQPIIQAAPFQITVIQLEPGEKFTNISSGDPTRWSYAVAVSGKDDAAQQNILVKPSLPDISTNLVISTNQRLYNLRLVSTQTDKLTRNIRFYYPEDRVNSKDDKMPSFEEESIEEQPNYIPTYPIVCNHYRITTGGFFSRPPVWQPLRVLDDGVHTYIQFPDYISQRDLPALFVVNGSQKECVNYRFKAPFMIVDKIFDEATLVTGVGGSQQAVILTNLYN